MKHMHLRMTTVRNYSTHTYLEPQFQTTSKESAKSGPNKPADVLSKYVLINVTRCATAKSNGQTPRGYPIGCHCLGWLLVHGTLRAFSGGDRAVICLSTRSTNHWAIHLASQSADVPKTRAKGRKLLSSCHKTFCKSCTPIQPTKGEYGDVTGTQLQHWTSNGKENCSALSSKKL